MGLRDMLKKRDERADGTTKGKAVQVPAPAEITLIRSDTHSQEVIQPPGDGANDLRGTPTSRTGSRSPQPSLDFFRPQSDESHGASPSSETNRPSSSVKRRLSERLHLGRQLPSSERVPSNLPAIVTSANPQEDKDGTESQWEKRATILAEHNELASSRPTTPAAGQMDERPVPTSLDDGRNPSPVLSPQIDLVIQEAIHCHEEGQLEKSTAIFARLADPQGANNPLSQVLYGLALRHGWGCEPDPEAAVRYLSAAASNAATVEQMALAAGMKKGGAAKGELVLAIFELANCFRHGWGIPKDSVAAKQYYETAANLGDTDAMNEVAWCYLEGFGCKKDKV
ncbi:Tetratricopeptide-like helical [Drechmeria coniospora]|uniref:Tetratricopeptide-like helical n=1 Tax=Drechmeria coniospora TaxID=98403 RepID=A0A151GKR3_DRECN|nr:Tetratricopeptide-like helical [Drechmeria coniospora]KYK57694.1 Tetratricopeptide-like helical [Drechmeria coniospora]